MKVGDRWRYRKSGVLPVGRVEPVESAGGAGGIFSGTRKFLPRMDIQRELSTLLFLQREFNTNGVYTSEVTVHVKAVSK